MFPRIATVASSSSVLVGRRSILALRRSSLSISSLSSSLSTTASQNYYENTTTQHVLPLFVAALTLGTAVATTTAVACDAAAATMTTTHPHFTPSQVATEPFPTQNDNENEEDETNNHPVYTSDQVAENDGTNGKPIWMSYGGVVYDVTDFIANHPGGSEKVGNKRRRRRLSNEEGCFDMPWTIDVFSSISLLFLLLFLRFVFLDSTSSRIEH